MKKTFFGTVAYLSNTHKNPTLEIDCKIPEYTNMIIKEYTSGKVVIPAGLDDKGRPYFSDEFYQNLREEYDRVIKYDKERARNLFWFDVTFEL